MHDYMTDGVSYEEYWPAGEQCLIDHLHGKCDWYCPLCASLLGEDVRWYLRAAEQGHAGAQKRLGFAYAYGVWGLEEDAAQAVRWFREAADQGEPRAQSCLGWRYWKGEGVPKDLVLAHMLLDLAAEADVLVGLWLNDLAKEMTPDQIAKAQRLAKEWKPKIRPAPGIVPDKDTPEFQDWVFRQHLDGKCGWQCDWCVSVRARVVHWCRIAAERGHIGAQMRLGFAYESGGWGLEQNAAEAVRWFREAADRGEPHAQDRLAELYLSGQGVPKDYAEAAPLCREAADQDLSPPF